MSASVPPQNPHAKECEEPDRGSALDVGALIPATVAVGAALAYGVLILAYSEFYAELGVRPDDVGLEYGPGLAGISGVAALLILASLVVGLYVAISSRLTPASRLIGAGAVGVLTVGALAWFLVDDAREAAAKARNGEPVGPLTFEGVEVVALRADLATVIPADPKAADSETYSQLRNRRTLMYLGRSAGGLVLYDPDRERSWQIPASMFTVRTVNCEENVEDKEPQCPDESAPDGPRFRWRIGTASSRQSP